LPESGSGWNRFQTGIYEPRLRAYLNALLIDPKRSGYAYALHQEWHVVFPHYGIEHWEAVEAFLASLRERKPKMKIAVKATTASKLRAIKRRILYEPARVNMDSWGYRMDDDYYDVMPNLQDGRLHRRVGPACEVYGRIGSGSMSEVRISSAESART